MAESPEHDPWAARLAGWSRRLRAAHLDGVVATLLDVVAPLSPFGASLLWIAQPVLGLVAPRDDIASMARLLEDPRGIDWLRERLIGVEDEGP